MAVVGIRDLKARTSEILRDVRENGTAVDVAYHGKIVARIIPVNEPTVDTEKVKLVLADLDRLREQIRTRWPVGVSATDAIQEVRRDL